MSGGMHAFPTEPVVEVRTMKHVVMMVAGVLGALLLVAAIFTAASTPWPRSADPAELSRVDAAAELHAADAWTEFWSGGALLILTGALAVWPQRKPSQ